MECWFETNTPIFHYSNTPFCARASPLDLFEQPARGFLQEATGAEPYRGSFDETVMDRRPLS